MRCETNNADFELLDWRRRTFALYAEVRALAARAPVAAHKVWVETRTALYQLHPQSPTASRHGTPANDLAPLHAPYDPVFRFTVDVEPIATDGRDVSDQAIGADGAIRLTPAMTTVGLRDTLEAELTIYRLSGYAGGLFLPFRDATSGSTTYGGGRYLLDTIKGADLGLGDTGHLVLDFNFAYHPSCCHAPTWVCPLAPPQNTLSVPMAAGEMLPEDMRGGQ